MSAFVCRHYIHALFLSGVLMMLSGAEIDVLMVYRYR